MVSLLYADNYSGSNTDCLRMFYWYLSAAKFNSKSSITKFDSIVISLTKTSSVATVTNFKTQIMFYKCNSFETAPQIISLNQFILMV